MKKLIFEGPLKLSLSSQGACIYPLGPIWAQSGPWPGVACRLQRWHTPSLAQCPFECQKGALTRYHPGRIYLEIPRKIYVYHFFLIFEIFLIKYLGFWSK